MPPVRVEGLDSLLTGERVKADEKHFHISDVRTSADLETISPETGPNIMPVLLLVSILFIKK